MRFRIPDDLDLSFDDLVRGEISFPAGSTIDYVVVRPNGKPLYTLVNPVDDALMGITHVLRGEDILSSTPRQIAMHNALVDIGLETAIPRFGHLPYVMGEGNKKLSKRDPQANLLHHRDRGFIPEGLLNYLSLLGWSIAADRDIFSVDELVAAFDVEDVNLNPPDLTRRPTRLTVIRFVCSQKRTSPIAWCPLVDGGVIGEEPSAEEFEDCSRGGTLVQSRVAVMSEIVGLTEFLLRRAKTSSTKMTHSRHSKMARSRR